MKINCKINHQITLYTFFIYTQIIYSYTQTTWIFNPEGYTQEITNSLNKCSMIYIHHILTFNISTTYILLVYICLTILITI